MTRPPSRRRRVRRQPCPKPQPSLPFRPSRGPRPRPSRTGDGEAGADGGARAKLWRAGDKAGGDARAEDAKTEHGERGEYDRQRLRSASEWPAHRTW
jgi:hypothetical protein